MSETRYFFSSFDSARAHVRAGTSLSDDELDEKDDIVMIVYMQCQSFYDNRSREVEKPHPNRAFEEIINQHRTNYIV